MKQTIFTIFLIVLMQFDGFTQDENNGLLPITIEAESGELGVNYVQKTSDELTYIAISKDYTGQSYPEGPASMATYQVDFSVAGTYHLYAKMRVGSGGYNDDSFFAGKGFGEKNETDGADWVMVNGLGGAGFASSTDVVDGPGVAGSEIWKWVNITQNFFGGDANSFTIEDGDLNQIFQIGSREDGLDFDKFVFARSDLYFTVDMLEKGLEGSLTVPEPDSSNFYMGPPLAVNSPKFLGNVKADFDSNFKSLWNQLTPGNDGKWASVAYASADSTKWDWSNLDHMYNYAKNNGLIFKEHTLIWGAQQPSWLNDLSEAEQLKHIESWIRQVGNRYPDIDLADVVNEPIASHNPPDGQNGRANYKEALGGDGETGWDWVVTAFELARKYLPNTKLILNDYGIINSNSATTTYLEIINILKDRKLIDGIGVQGHRFELESVSTSVIQANLDRLAATGLPIYMSEVDFGNLKNEGTPDDQEQLELYQKVFPVLWNHPQVHGITLWGYIENHMWQSSCFLAYADGSWRPALDWIASYVAENPGEIIDLSTANKQMALPAQHSMLKAYPNPFNQSITLQVDLKVETSINLKIYNIEGKEVATLADGWQEAGTHQFSWNASDQNSNLLPAGTYFYRLITEEQIVNGKIMLIK